MEPALNNIVIASISVIYVFAVVALMDLLVKKGLPQDISRKIVHICAGSWLLFWFLFDDTHWTKYLNIAPAFVWTVLLLIKGLTASPEDNAVKTMTRTGDRKELLRGPLYFTLVMNVMGTVFFYNPAAAISMGILGWGDGLAPLFGKKYGRIKYNFVTEKSYVGSLAFLIFGIIGAVINSVILFGRAEMIPLITIAFIAAVVEALSPKDLDNILIPSVCILIYFLL